MRGYDAWKLASPYDDKNPSGQSCRYCQSEFLMGESVLQEGITGDYFCDSICFKEFVTKNIDDYIELIEASCEVSSVELDDFEYYEEEY